MRWLTQEETIELLGRRDLKAFVNRYLLGKLPDKQTLKIGDVAIPIFVDEEVPPDHIGILEPGGKFYLAELVERKE